jgi:DNA topoisomerase-2
MLPEIKPWYRGFEGTIENDGNKFISYGIIKKDKNKVEVSELPIGMWTDKFKETCEDWIVEKQIKNMKNNSTPKKVKFIITESDDGFDCNINNMKLYTYLHISNMVLFNEKEQLKKYSIDQIINDFCKMRFEYYIKRKKYILNNLEKDLKHNENKSRFIEEIIEKKLNIMNIDEEVILKELEKRKYDKEFKKDSDGEETSSGYNYLLKLQIRTFTTDKVKQLKDDILTIKNKIEKVNITTEKDMWLNDLDEFKKEYNKWLIIMNENDNKKQKRK